MLPLYLDSPMASRARDVYLRHPEVYDEETAALLRSGDSPLAYPGEQYTNRSSSRRRSVTQPRPIMVVASSGMLTGGRIMHHLKDFLPDPACTLLFIGYQGRGRWVGTCRAAARRRASTTPSTRCAARWSRSRASRPMPTSTS